MLCLPSPLSKQSRIEIDSHISTAVITTPECCGSSSVVLCYCVACGIIVYDFCFDSAYCRLNIESPAHAAVVCSMSIPGMRTGCVLRARWLRDR